MKIAHCGTILAGIIAVTLLGGCSSATSSDDSSLPTLDFSKVMVGFAHTGVVISDGTQASSSGTRTAGSFTNTYWNVTPVAVSNESGSSDAISTATIAGGSVYEAISGTTTPVMMLKGNPGTLADNSATPGVLVTDTTVDHYYASGLFLNGASAAQYGDGIYKFKLKTSSPLSAGSNVWNAMVVFRDNAPQKLLDDAAVTKALAIAVIDGKVSILKKDSSGVTTVASAFELGVTMTDSAYHYFVFSMQDTSSTETALKLWVDGVLRFNGSATGVTGKGAINVLHNSTPYVSTASPVVANNGDTVTGVAGHSTPVTYTPLTACGETYFGSYDSSGPVVTSATRAVK